MPGTQYLLWLDFETTGLHTKLSRPLEVGWTITDEQLRQLSPLRQRFIHIPADPYGGHRSELAGPLWVNDHTFDEDKLTDPRGWGSGHMDQVVVDMHAKSGLRDAWLDIYRSNPSAMIRRPSDLTRLITEDLATLPGDHHGGSGFRVNDGDRLALAGAGVSHFDNQFLAEQFPDLFSAHPLVKGWTYWYFDTSTASRVLGPAVEQRIARVLADAYAAESDVPYSVVESECGARGPMLDVGEVVVDDPRGANPVFALANVRQHRAADDVVEALLRARALRHMVETARW